MIVRNSSGILRRLWIGGAVLLVLGGVVAAYLLSDRSAPPSQPKKQVQRITVIAPPPPPPPQEQPPPPEEIKQKIEEAPPEPEPEAPAEAPPAELGVDAEGAAGSDGFGLVGRRGGQSLLGGGNGNAMIWYGQKLSSEVSDALRESLEPESKRHKFRVIVNLWVDAEGRVSRAELAEGSGDGDVDAVLKKNLESLRLRWLQAPPPDMPQPIKIQVINK